MRHLIDIHYFSYQPNDLKYEAFFIIYTFLYDVMRIFKMFLFLVLHCCKVTQIADKNQEIIHFIDCIVRPNLNHLNHLSEIELLCLNFIEILKSHSLIK